MTTVQKRVSSLSLMWISMKSVSDDDKERESVLDVSCSVDQPVEADECQLTQEVTWLRERTSRDVESSSYWPVHSGSRKLSAHCQQFPLTGSHAFPSEQWPQALEQFSPCRPPGQTATHHRDSETPSVVIISGDYQRGLSTGRIICYPLMEDQ